MRYRARQALQPSPGGVLALTGKPMITIKKLSSLKKETALRKAAALLQGFEVELAAGRGIDAGYLADLIRTIIVPAGSEFSKPGETALSVLEGLRRAGAMGGGASEARGAAFPPAASALQPLRRVCNDLRHLLHARLDMRPADWDLLPPAGFQGVGHPEERAVLPFTVFLEDLRSPFNVGSVIRSAESFCVDQVILTPSCPAPDSPRASRSAMGCDKIVPWTVGGLEMLSGQPVFALETGGILLEEFDFPEKGAVILGNEELGISPEAHACAEASAGIVSISMYGTKGSLNVNAAFAILIHFWTMRVISAGRAAEKKTAARTSGRRQ